MPDQKTASPTVRRWSRDREPCWLGQMTLYDRDHLFWVTQGRAEVGIGKHRLWVGESQMVRFPAGTTVDWIRTTPGSVASSALVAPGDAGVRGDVPEVRQVTENDRLALIRHYVRWISPFWTGPVAGLPADTPASHCLYTPDVRRIAEALLEDPTDGRDLVDWAALSGLSTRQLSRRFLTETGWTFRQWRTRLRIQRARQLLGSGMTPSEVSSSVGYGSLPGFIRSFRQETGLTPGAFTVDAGQDGGQVAAEACSVRPLSCSGPSTAMYRINRFHLMIWMVQGTGRLRIGDDVSLPLGKGDSVWVPAGVWHVLRVDSGGVMLPVGVLPGSVPLRRHHVDVIHYAEQWLPEFLYRSGVNFTHLKPWPRDRSTMRDLLPASVSAWARHDPVITDIVSADPGRPSRTLSEWAEDAGMSPSRLADRFRRETGQSFPVWQMDRKLHDSLFLLAEPGVSVSQTAHAAGYPHVSGFTRAFSRRYAMTPTEFRRRFPVSYLYEEVTG